MKSIKKHVSTAVIISSILIQGVASAQALSVKEIKVPGLKAPEFKVPPKGCLSCPDLSKLPKLKDDLTQAERLEAIAEIDKAIQDLKDLPDVSPKVLTSVDYWERLKPIEKENIISHKFGNNYNWAAAAIAVAVVALAYEVAKDYTNRWHPGEADFDHILTVKDLNYMKNPAVQLQSLDFLQSRLTVFQGLSQVANGLNY